MQHVSIACASFTFHVHAPNPLIPDKNYIYIYIVCVLCAFKSLCQSHTLREALSTHPSVCPLGPIGHELPGAHSIAPMAFAHTTGAAWRQPFYTSARQLSSSHHPRRQWPPPGSGKHWAGGHGCWGGDVQKYLPEAVPKRKDWKAWLHKTLRYSQDGLISISYSLEHPRSTK